MKKIEIYFKKDGDNIVFNVPQLDHSWSFPNLATNIPIMIRNISKPLGEYIENNIERDKK